MSGLRLVINFDLPETVDTYIHRIGRTGRAGRKGEALSICAVVDQEKLGAFLRRLDKGWRLPMVTAIRLRILCRNVRRVPARDAVAHRVTSVPDNVRTGPRNGQRAGQRSGSPTEQRDDDRPQRARLARPGQSRSRCSRRAEKDKIASGSRQRASQGQALRTSHTEKHSTGINPAGPNQTGANSAKINPAGQVPQGKPREDAAFQAGAHQAADKNRARIDPPYQAASRINHRHVRR